MLCTSHRFMSQPGRLPTATFFRHLYSMPCPWTRVKSPGRRCCWRRGLTPSHLWRAAPRLKSLGSRVAERKEQATCLVTESFMRFTYSKQYVVKGWELCSYEGSPANFNREDSLQWRS